MTLRRRREARQARWFLVSLLMVVARQNGEPIDGGRFNFLELAGEILS